MQPLLCQACKPVPEAEQLRSELATPALGAAVGTGALPVHSPLRQLLFRDFCEALVRIANLKYQQLPGLQQRLHQLLHGAILPGAVKVMPAGLGDLVTLPLSWQRLACSGNTCRRCRDAAWYGHFAMVLRLLATLSGQRMQALLHEMFHAHLEVLQCHLLAWMAF